jgi:hypothetical protein
MKKSILIAANVFLPPLLVGCDSEPHEIAASIDGYSQDSATLYRNSPLDLSIRVHWATFDTENSNDYNMNNCELAARVMNANVDASAVAAGNERNPMVGFWCELGGFRETGTVPQTFESEFPSDVRSELRFTR